jgi:hypothetical protein
MMTNHCDGNDCGWGNSKPCICDCTGCRPGGCEEPATGAGHPVDWDAVDARWSEAQDALSDFVPEPDSETVAHFAAVLDKVKADARRAALEEAAKVCDGVYEDEREYHGGQPDGAKKCRDKIRAKGGEGDG